MAEHKGVTYCDTVQDTYTRATTGLAFAVGEATKIKNILADRAKRLRAEADEIDTFLKTASKHTDDWYEIISSECNAARLANRK